jgi:hypothetical protein
MTDTVDHSSDQRHRGAQGPGRQAPGDQRPGDQRPGDQGPAFSSMRKCLDAHSRDRRRQAFARFIGISPLGAESIELFRAAEGESLVSELVRGLGSGWTVLNAVPIGSGHSIIDYSLVGPVGVVLITIRRHVGSRVMLTGESLTVDGIRVDHLRNAAYETERVRSAVERITGRPIAVTHVVVLLGVDHIVHFGHKPSIAVVRPSDLGGWLRSLPRVFGDKDVAEVSTIAETRVQWSADGINHPNTIALEGEFGVLREEVLWSENRRRAVGLVTALAVLLSGIGFLAIAAPTVFSIFAR